MGSIDLDQNPGVIAARHSGAAIPFVRANAFQPFVVFLDSIGAPVDRLLSEARVPSVVTEDPEALVPVMLGYRFIELAARQERIENIGVLVARGATAFDLGAYGVALRGVPTVYEYLQAGIRMIGTHSSGTRIWLRPEGKRWRVSQHLVGPPGLGRCVADLFTLVLTITTLRQFLGPAWSPEEVRLLEGDEALLGDTDVFGNARLVTGQRCSSMTVSRSLMATPAPAWLHAANGGADVQPVAGQEIPADFRASAEQLVASLLVDGYPGIEIAADAAGMSKRTLQRRLAEAGLSYSGLVSASRLRLAKSWLAGSDMPVTEIASVLGYNAASNFVRAFRRETGITPGAFRCGQLRD
jgi:AraC-like DNA-binding protein